MEIDEQEEDEDKEIPMAPHGGRTKTEEGGTSSTNSRKSGIRYRECKKNHAVSIGLHALDGCCEFLAAGEEGTLDALKCAACDCHRNFHRKESMDGGGATDHHNNYHQFSASPYYRAPHPSGYTPQAHHSRPLAREEGEDASIPSSSGGGGGSGSKKRHRTKFTAEQKEKMREFSERIGWRIQKHAEAAVDQFCLDTGVNRHVLKVWMHNNKHTLGRKP